MNVLFSEQSQSLTERSSRILSDLHHHYLFSSSYPKRQWSWSPFPNITQSFFFFYFSQPYSVYCFILFLISRFYVIPLLTSLPNWFKYVVFPSFSIPPPPDSQSNSQEYPILIINRIKIIPIQWTDKTAINGFVNICAQIQFWSFYLWICVCGLRILPSPVKLEINDIFINQFQIPNF